MFPQGAGFLNIAYFESLIERINSCRTQSELATIGADIDTTVNAQVAGIAANLAVITPMLSLLTPPTSPNEVITWAGNVISDFLTPILKPAVSYAQQSTLLATQQAAIAAAIASKKGSLPI